VTGGGGAAAVSIDVANESGRPVDVEALAGVARFVLDTLAVHPLAELSVLCVDAAEMTRLHESFMGEPGPTDVLAFGMDELPSGRGDGGDDDTPPVMLGDVVLCPEVAERQAAAAGQSSADELTMLCVHGVLHLLGYDHGDEGSERQMFAVQDRLLGRWRELRR
jgi:probable rRNA maturation factor